MSLIGVKYLVVVVLTLRDVNLKFTHLTFCTRLLAASLNATINSFAARHRPCFCFAEYENAFWHFSKLPSVLTHCCCIFYSLYTVAKVNFFSAYGCYDAMLTKNVIDNVDKVFVKYVGI